MNGRWQPQPWNQHYKLDDAKIHTFSTIISAGEFLIIIDRQMYDFACMLILTINRPYVVHMTTRFCHRDMKNSKINLSFKTH